MDIKCNSSDESKSNEAALINYSNVLELKRPCRAFQELPHLSEFSKVSTIDEAFSKERIYLIFESAVSKKDKKYVLSKLKQLKKKKFSTVLAGCMKILEKYPNYFLVYLVAGAACRNFDKCLHDAPSYFSQALLINPNCLTAWWCLLKYYRDNIYVDNLIFETIFSGILHTEGSFEKWCSVVSELLEKSSGIFVSLREPLKLLAPFIHFSENEKLLFLSHAISEYIFKHRNEKDSVACINVGSDAFKVFHIFYRHDETFVKRVLSYLFCCGDYTGFMDFLEHIFQYTNIEKTTFKDSFYLKLLSFIPVVSSNFTNEMMHAILKIYRRRVREIRKKVRTRHSQVFASFGDFCTARDTYKARKKRLKKGQQIKLRETITVIWSYIEVGDWEKALKALITATKNAGYKLKKRKLPCKKKMLKRSILNIWLHVLTHGPTAEARKLGLLLSLKMSKDNKATVEVWYNACIGYIGLNMEDMAVNCLLHLLKYGAIKEIIYLKAILEKSYPAKIDYLNEISELVDAHKLKVIYSNINEKESRTFKSACKATIEAPGCIFLYEWLALYFYEKGDYTSAETYFEAALYYNPHSWTSIEYYPTVVAMHDKEDSKTFLDMYRTRSKFSSSELIAYKAAIQYLTLKCDDMDYFKAAENLMYAHRLSKGEKNRHYLELIGESFSNFGMFGASVKWLSECYIINNVRNIYAGTLLGKQYFLTIGADKYKSFMGRLVGRGGSDSLFCLYYAAHAFLLKSIKLSLKNNNCLSQVYCQQALFLCARAVTISSNFACLWKLMGDILYHCTSLPLRFGYLYVPDWLFSDSSTKKVIIIRRLQSLYLAIRCYFFGVSISDSSKEMKACLWNSSAVAYNKASTFCIPEDRKKNILLGIQCCWRALKERKNDSYSWNTLGILYKNYEQFTKEEITSYSSAAFELSRGTSRIPLFKLVATANLGFLYLSKGDIDRADQLFLYCRGRDTYLDFPWIGQILIDLNLGARDTDISNHILFLFKYTSHFPKTNVLLYFLNILKDYVPRSTIYLYWNKYKQFCGNHISSYKESLYSSLFNLKRENIDLALAELTLAMKMCNEFCRDEIQNFCIALNKYQSLTLDFKLKSLVSKISIQYYENIEEGCSLIEKYILDTVDFKPEERKRKQTHTSLRRARKKREKQKMISSNWTLVTK